MLRLQTARGGEVARTKSKETSGTKSLWNRLEKLYSHLYFTQLYTQEEARNENPLH